MIENQETNSRFNFYMGCSACDDNEKEDYYVKFKVLNNNKGLFLCTGCNRSETIMLKNTLPNLN